MKSINSRYICLAYIIICCLHEILWYIPFSILRLAILLLYLLIPIYFFFQVNQTRTGKYVKALNVLYLMFAIYGTLLLISGDVIMSVKNVEVNNYTYLLKISNSLLPFYAFYYFFRNGSLTEKDIRLWSIIFIVIAILSFRHNERTLLDNYSEMRFSREEFTNNSGYTILALIPLVVFFINKPILQYLLLSVCVYFTFSSMKRGAILIAMVCVIYVIYQNYVIYKKTKRKSSIGFFILSCIFIFIIFFIVNNLLETSSYFNERLQNTLEGDTNHRDEITALMVNHLINETTPLEFLFGGGAYNTLKATSRLAHNDWIEIMMNQGLLGIIVYIVYWITLIKTRLKNRSSQVYSLGLALFIIIYLLRTFFSMSYETVDFYAMIVLGYCMAGIDNNSYISRIKTTI